jgi:hypothetical protein
MAISPSFQIDKKSRLAELRCLVGGLLLLASPSVSPLPAPQDRLEGGDFIRVVEEPWKVGEVRSYTLLFDQVPFGRETVRLLELEGSRAERRLRFSQTLALDLRALGQRGFLTLASTTRYSRGRVAESYHLESLLKDRGSYSTYPTAHDPERRTVLDLELPAARMTWEAAGETRDVALPSTAGAMLVEPLSMVHWERLFLGDTWKVGETRTIDVLFPAGPARFDYHLRPFRPTPPTPERKSVGLTVEARETIEVFSVPIPSFRCVIPELGIRLWVSSDGGILKYEDGRGLVIFLER